MEFLAKAPPRMSITTIPEFHPRGFMLLNPSSICSILCFPKGYKVRSAVCCTKLTPWEPSPLTYAPTKETGSDFLKNTADVFETSNSDSTADSPATKSEQLVDLKDQPSVQLKIFKWPMWLLGPSLLLTTGMAPTLWLPLSSIFLGPNVASLLSLIGLDCIFNLGATLFLLMADFCSKPKNNIEQAHYSKPPFNYKFWNLVAAVSGFIIPLAINLGSQRGFLQPQLPSISFAVLLGPYLLLLSVQMLTEMLTWHWQSSVWLVTPVVYESYRVLQLMRGLKLGAELTAPTWILNVIRGLVCWWIFVLGIQLMSVAWFAGFTARAHQQQLSEKADI